MWNPFKPKIENSDPGQRSLQLISQKGMPFAYVEAYKSLRTNLNFLTSSEPAPLWSPVPCRKRPRATSQSTWP